MPNPWMSLWLSAAHSWAGVMRSYWTAQAHRQQTAMTNEMMRQTIRLWSGPWAGSSRGRKSKRPR